MKKRSLYFFVLFSLKVTMAHCNPLPDDFKNIYTIAENYLINENYNAALPQYLKLEAMKMSNANIDFKIGLCYLNASTNKTKAIPYLISALKNVTSGKYKEGDMKEVQSPFSAYYYLGKAYQLNYDWDNAIKNYEIYKKMLSTETKVESDLEETDRDIETCNNGKVLMKEKKNVIVTNLGKNLNTEYDDYSPVISLDEQTLILTSNRAGGTGNEMRANGTFYEDIYISHYENGEWQKAKSIGPNINTTQCEASINLSADGQKLLIYKDDFGDGNIYLSELNGKDWGVPEQLKAGINSPAWETHACLSSDNNILYFVSDRPGGMGGRDIYKCLKLPNGKWGPAQNLGDVINTQYDEDGVFIHPDGKQIFFSSKGHNSMGGFDIFTSTINDENGFWSAPVNIGNPINTPDDDVFFVTTADGKRAFVSSVKEGGLGNKDVYMLTYPEYEPRDITIIIGRIANNSKEDISKNTIKIINAKTNEEVQTLSANSATGKFGANLPIGKTYKISYTVGGKEISSEVINVTTGKGYQVIEKEIAYNGKTK